MQTNPARQIEADIAWNGTAVSVIDVSNHTNYGFHFYTTAPLTVDAIFEVDTFKPLAADPCTHDPATVAQVKEVAICTGVATPAANQRIVIPAGAVLGCRGGATLPCPVGKFVALRHISGGANVRAIAVKTGKMR